jgi:endonuclease-8
MPEGPTILLLKEALAPFQRRKILQASGNAHIDLPRLKNKMILEFRCWGKQLLICFNDITVRVHLLMFGSFRINERKETAPRLSLKFTNGEVNFYSSSVKLLEGKADEWYDWSADILNKDWDPDKALKKVRQLPESLICDTLMEQYIFSGVGNIIKNETLYRVKIHPGSLTGKVPARKLKELIRDIREYSFLFLEWKRIYELKKHWQVYNKSICPRCHLPLVKNHLGEKNRRNFYCNNCQILYQ